MTQDDPKDLIALYALDALEPEDARRVEAYLEHHPEAQEELRAHREVAARLARAVPQLDPPPHLEARVMERIRTLKATPTPAPIPFTPSPRAEPRPSALRWLVPAMAVAASVVAIVLAVQNARLNMELEAQRKLGAESAQIIATASRTLPMLTPDTQTEVGRVVIAPDGRVLFVHNLPALPPGKTWQAWYIRADNPAPVALGVFSGSSTLERVPDGVAALAVSEEPEGGSKVPTVVRGLAKI